MKTDSKRAMGSVRLGIWSSAVIAIVASLTPSQTTLFSENFQGGISGWTVNNYASGLWHIAGPGTCGSTSMTAAYNTTSATCSYSAGQGVATGGELISPLITLTGSGTYQINYTCWLGVDPTGDTAQVAYRVYAPFTAPFWTPVTPSAPAIGFNAQRSHTFTATPGTAIKLRFYFTADGIGNSGTGWMIDNVQLVALAPVTAPVVAAVLPNHGPTTGAAAVVISGSNFTGTTAVTFGSTPATFTVINGTTLSVDAPPNASGWTSINVTGPGGTGTLSNAFDYYVPPSTFGTGCNGTTLSVAGAPTLGSTFTVQVSGSALYLHTVAFGNSNTISSAGVLPMSLAPYGFSGCALRVSPDFIAEMGTQSSAQVFVPNNPALVGSHLYLQAANRSATTTGFSPALDVLIGL